MSRLISLWLVMIGITGCATDNISIHSYSYRPYLYNQITYEHPIDAVYFGGRTYPVYINHRAYDFMSNKERRAVDHYLRSLNKCYSGNWFIQGGSGHSVTRIEGNNGRRCDDVMQVYRNLYKVGYPWGESLSHLLIERPFSKLLDQEDQCKKSGQTINGKLEDNGKAVFTCEERV